MNMGKSGERQGGEPVHTQLAVGGAAWYPQPAGASLGIFSFHCYHFVCDVDVQ